MCGIAGVLYKKGTSDVGTAMTSMLDSLKHRGPDSTGYCLYGDRAHGAYVMWLKIDEYGDVLDKEIYAQAQREEIGRRIGRMGGKVSKEEVPTIYSLRLEFAFEGDTKRLEDYIEAMEGVEITSFGKSMELVKDVGLAEAVSDKYHLKGFKGTHAIGHVRMATESAVDVSHAHPFWAYPFEDIATVHNGQITNYFKTRRELESRGHRFKSHCDSELISVYVADRLSRGDSLEDSLERSKRDLDGVFTYIVCTKDSIGVAKDELAAKPLVVYENDKLVALASEEVALRQVFHEEIDSWDPYDGAVLVWSK